MSNWYILNPDKTVSLAVTEEEKQIAYAQVGSGSKFVAQTNIGNSLVSTVFLGLDHALASDRPPILFETMVFRVWERGWESTEMWQYTTWQEAINGHKRACEQCKSGLSREELEMARTVIESLLPDRREM